MYEFQIPVYTKKVVGEKNQQRSAEFYWGTPTNYEREVSIALRMRLELKKTPHYSQGVYHSN